MNGALFSFRRFWAVVVKEFMQLRRDRMTFAMIVAIPLVQTMLFGYAINSDPKHMPTALVLGESTFLTRSLEAALRHAAELTGHFSLRATTLEDVFLAVAGRGLEGK